MLGPAILVFIVDEAERVLLLSHPERPDCWEVVNGAIEENETVLEAACREAREEAGSKLRLRPLGTVHASSFHFDEAVGNLISIAYVMACDGGNVIPGDDMAGSRVRWATPEEIERQGLNIVAPELGWLLRRAVQLYRLWNREPGVDLERRKRRAQ